METVYVETTIVGNIAGRLLGDPAAALRQQETRTWWPQAMAHFELLISPVVMDECGAGDPTAAQERLDVVKNLRILTLTDDCRALASNLISRNAVPATEPRDALHISIAAVHCVKYLVTWNFKHIANATMRQDIEFVINEFELTPPIICTPQELSLDNSDD